MHKTDTSRLYDTYPHLRRIEELWGTKPCRDLLSELMTDTRGGSRTGFPPDHATTLMRLLIEHDRQYPAFDGTSDGKWMLSEQGRRGLER